MSQTREPVRREGEETAGETEARGRRARAFFGARSLRRARPRAEGPPPTAELLAERLQSECENLRSALEIALARVAHRVVVITSAIPEEGSTTILAALGFNLAVRGTSRVLLVDANVRRPALDKIFGLPGDVGVGRVLTGRTEAAMAVVSTPFPGLSVLPMGGENLLPAHLFGPEGVASIVAGLREHYHYVLVDTPALLAVPEVAVLAGEVDGVILVARAGRTKRETLLKARNLLQRSGAHVLGVVLNRRRYVIPSAVYKRI